MRIALSSLAAVMLSAPLAATAQIRTGSPSAPVARDSLPQFEQRKLSGPRLGMVIISGSRATARLNDRGLRPVMSVFGWHFESVTRSREGGPQFVAQQVLAVAGLEQGTAIPSFSSLVGVRFANGMEFGAGPNVSPLGAAMTVAVGKSVRLAGGVLIPLNVAVIMGKGSTRTSLLVGYAIRHH